MDSWIPVGLLNQFSIVGYLFLIFFYYIHEAVIHLQGFFFFFTIRIFLKNRFLWRELMHHTLWLFVWLFVHDKLFPKPTVPAKWIMFKSTIAKSSKLLDYRDQQEKKGVALGMTWGCWHFILLNRDFKNLFKNMRVLAVAKWVRWCLRSRSDMNMILGPA